jgi:hypothetical protein
MKSQSSLRLLFLLLFATVSLGGCVTTQVKGYTDRDYNHYKVERVVVRAPNTDFAFAELLEQSMVRELINNGVRAASFLDMFPPTRQWTNDEVNLELRQQRINTIMYINLGSSESHSQTIGYINSGTASVYGNTATYSGHSTAVTTFHRYTSTRVKIYEVASGRTVWVGDSTTRAGGLLYMDDETQTESMAEETIASLKSNGHI